MDNNKKSTSRGKLTLKLKLPTSSGDPSKLTIKATEKKIGNSGVQVTIKGRKREQLQLNKNSRSLSENELRARKLALGNIDNKNFKENDFDVLSKIKNQKQIETIEEDLDEIIPEPEAPPEEIIVENIQEEQPEIVENNNISYQVDDFNVINKIKNSIAKQNEAEKKAKEERNKILEANKKQEEQEKAKKESEKLKDKKKFKKHKDSYEEEDEQNSKKSKLAQKKEKNFNSRRLLQTYVIEDDDGSEFRRKNKHKNKEREDSQKEYKKITQEVILPELITVSDLSARMNEKTGDVVKKLFTMGMVATSNQVIDADTAELIIEEFGHVAKRVKDSDVENILEEENSENLPKLERAPVVTIMGHVDHGKTSLLDAMRSTKVVEDESGGITQHIGASRIKTKSGKYITFLDTPGHEAFTEMRLRGANATDIVVLVVAADDGVKEQTIEAINHAKAAAAPIIVAVNKIDKPSADSSRVKHELLNYEIIAEDLSGDVMFVEVSAKEKINLDKLEEAILLQAEILDLKAPYEGKSNGVVIEAKIDPNKGVIASVLVQNGTLDIGDMIVVDTSYGKIRKMTDDRGKNIKQATPSMAVEILGLNIAPDAGTAFVEVDEEKKARDIISYREKKKRDEKALKNTAKSTSDIFKQAGDKGIKYLPIIIKADVHGSVEAITGSLEKLSNDEVAIKVIHSATGGITQSDISLASVSGAIILGFNVRANAAAKEQARVKNINVRYHSIIYNVVDEVKLMLGGLLDPIKNEEYLGQAEIRQVFKITGAGKIGGSFVTDGQIKRGAKVRLLRDDVVIFDGSLKTLKRFKEDVKEVKQGFECGIALENYDDLKEGDKIECYQIVEEQRSL